MQRRPNATKSSHPLGRQEVRETCSRFSELAQNGIKLLSAVKDLGLNPSNAQTAVKCRKQSPETLSTLQNCNVTVLYDVVLNLHFSTLH